MSVESAAVPKRALDSSLESQMSYWRVFLALGGAIFLVAVAYRFFFLPPAPRVAPVATAQIVVVTATPGGVTGAAALPLAATATAAPTVGAQIVVVTATATPEPEIMYVPQPYVVEVEVTRLVEVVAVALPTPTLEPGVMRICIYVEGVSGLYINGQGMAGNACYSYGVSGPVTDFELRVTGGDSYVEAAKAAERD